MQRKPTRKSSRLKIKLGLWDTCSRKWPIGTRECSDERSLLRTVFIMTAQDANRLQLSLIQTALLTLSSVPIVLQKSIHPKKSAHLQKSIHSAHPQKSIHLNKSAHPKKSNHPKKKAPTYKRATTQQKEHPPEKERPPSKEHPPEKEQPPLLLAKFPHRVTFYLMNAHWEQTLCEHAIRCLSNYWL